MADQLVDALSRLYYGENRKSLSNDEAMAIADTVMNRTKLRGYPSDPIKVLYQPAQYTPLAPPPSDDPALAANSKATAAFGPNDPLWSVYNALAQKAVDPNRSRSPFTHYFSGATPKWAKKLGVVKIGDHYFATDTTRRAKDEE